MLYYAVLGKTFLSFRNKIKPLLGLFPQVD